MTSKDVFIKLGDHLSRLGMGYPVRDDLIDILRENFSELEAEVALAIPNRVIPLQPVTVEEISGRVNLPIDELKDTLRNLAGRGLLYSGPTEDGRTGYALHQVGFGFPQSFFWGGEDTPHARKMAGLIAKYFNRKVTGEAYGSETKPYRYIPIAQSIEKDEIQAVMPEHMMKKLIEGVELFALAHCPCRVTYKLLGRKCEHPLDVCLKFDEMARYVIDQGLAKEITREEALDVIKRSTEAGLVHFVDNAEGKIKHNCNCCGCACWNVGALRRRKIPRDDLMACYFIRETDEDKCTGCGECLDICPVDALKLEGDIPEVDTAWCIGCGVCDTVCPSDTVKIVRRPDKAEKLPAKTTWELHEKILKEKAKSQGWGF